MEAQNKENFTNFLKSRHDVREKDKQKNRKKAIDIIKINDIKNQCKRLQISEKKNEPGNNYERKVNNNKKSSKSSLKTSPIRIHDSFLHFFYPLHFLVWFLYLISFEWQITSHDFEKI